MKQILFGIIFFVTLVSCGDEKAKMYIGEYVYQDTMGVIHINNECAAVSKTKEGSQPVKVLYTDLLTDKHLDKICSQCVKKEHIDSIRIMLYTKKIEENDEEEYYNHSLGFNIRQWLYVKMGGKLSDNRGWSNFNLLLEDKTQRMLLYNTVKKQLTDLPEYDKFCAEIDKYREDEKEQMFFVDK